MSVTRVHIVVHPFIVNEESEHVCDNCLTPNDQTEGTLTNYGDESCCRCDFHSGDSEEED
jgi:hypothetical protein